MFKTINLDTANNFINNAAIHEDSKFRSKKILEIICSEFKPNSGKLRAKVICTDQKTRIVTLKQKLKKDNFESKLIWKDI